MIYNPFKLIKTIFNKPAINLSSVLNSATSALTGKDLFGFMWRSKQHSSDSSLTLSAVYCAVNLYTGAIGSLPRTVYKLNSEGIVDKQLNTSDHPAVKIFLHYANPNYTADDFITDITNDILLDGNYYALREFDSQLRTLRVHYIHPSRIPRGNIFRATGKEKLSTGDIPAIGSLIYRIETGERSKESNPEYMLLPKDMIIHLKGNIPDKTNNRSYGIVEKAVRSFSMYENSEEFGVHFFKNGHKNQTFLTTEQRLSADVLKRVEGFFESNPNHSIEDAFKTRILELGLKPINAAIPLAQLQFIETRAFSVEDVGRWFSIPPLLLHSNMGNSGGVTDVAQLIHLFIQTGLHPLINRIRNQLKSELLPLSSQIQYSFEFNLIYLFRTVINEFSQALRNFFEIGVMDRTEIANLLGMKVNPKDKNNTLRYVPTNLMTVEHSLALRDKAQLSNNLLEEQIKTAELDNENYTSPADLQKAKTEADKPDPQDKSPDQPNIDKKIRTAKNALLATFVGLQNYEIKVLNQKLSKSKEPEELKTSIKEFYTNDKFLGTLTNGLHEWEEHIKEWLPFESLNDLINEWHIHSIHNLTLSGDPVENVIKYHTKLNMSIK